MSKILFGIVTFAVVLAFATGCRLRSLSISAYDHDRHGYAHGEVVHHDYVHHEPASVRVYTRRGHVCGFDCHDHYWNGVKLLVLDGGHRHGPHCGHHWSGSRWTLVAKKAGKSHHHKGAKIKIRKYRH
ncbi:MAG: hypothetical protein IH897_15240 [Planctomycetes bacterium]|nr:hypothetical protein [Planctomycetota bacterium]